MKNTIKLLIEAINGESTRLSIPVQHGFEFFDTNDIIRLESDGNYTRIFLKNKTTLTISKTLKVYDELLSRKGFVRIHASHLINIRELKSYYKGAGGYVVMSDGSRIDVSKSKKDEFLIRLNFSNFEKLT
jgi:two-component system LytT family response regulator